MYRLREKNILFHENIIRMRKCFLQCQIVVRGREQFALAAIFKLDLSDPHTRT